MKIALWLFAPLVMFGEITPPPGQLVDIGGSKLHIHCSGSGSPVVILDAGFPGSSLDWTLVQPAAAQFTRVCSYDRAGFGWSEQGKPPMSAARIADDLNALLAKAEITAPYVFAAHSMGGLYARAFIRKFPASVAGLILVDATHEDQWDFEPSRHWQPRGSPPLRYKQQEVERPAAAAAILKEMWASDAWKSGERAERDGIKLTVEEAKREPKRLPAMPLIVLSPGVETNWFENVPVTALKGQQLQREMAAFSALSLWVPVPGANHYIHLSQPGAVIEAIRQVVQAVRSY